MKQRNGCRTNCDVGKVAEGSENEALPHSPTLRRFTYVTPFSAALPTSQLILQPFRCFTYVIDTSLTSQLIFQPFRRFIYVTAHSTTVPLLYIRHRHFTYVTWRAAYVHDSVMCNDCGPQDYMEDVNWLSKSKGWRPLLYSESPEFKSRCWPNLLGYLSWFSTVIKANAMLDLHYHDPFTHS